MGKSHKILGLILLFLLLSGQVFAKKIILVADPWPPFNMEPGGQQEGYMVDIARKIFEKHGYEVIYKTIPWKRAIESTRAGAYTGLIGASKTDAKGFVFPSHEMSRNYLAFYVRRDDPWIFTDQSSIESRAVGVIAGYDYRKWLNRYIQQHKDNHKKIQVVGGTSPLEQNLKKLIGERIDVVVGNEAVIRHTARKMALLSKIKAAGYGREPSFIYIAFSPALRESPQLAGMLDEGISSMRQNGQLQDILSKYNLKDWAQ